MKYSILFLLLCSLSCLAQKPEVLHINSIPTEGRLLDQAWRWHAGDNLAWANPVYDDSKWKPINPTNDIKSLLPSPFIWHWSLLLPASLWPEN